MENTKKVEKNPFEFENYTKISSYYDLTRVAAGAESILSKLCKPNYHLLDAGSGTGNYACAMAPFVKKITAFEFNPGMIKRTHKKLNQNGIGNVEIVQGSLLEKLPFSDNHFDGIIINQVLHHLDDGSDPEFPNTQNLLKEFQRVLKPNGFLSINITTHKQDGTYWWQALIPRAQDDYLKKHIPEDLLIKYLTEAKLNLKHETQCKEPLQGSAYFNPAGPLDENWRNGDSTWSTLGKKRLNEVLDFVQKLIDQGSAGKFMDEHDAKRRELGQSTFFISFK